MTQLQGKPDETAGPAYELLEKFSEWKEKRQESWASFALSSTFPVVPQVLSGCAGFFFFQRDTMSRLPKSRAAELVSTQASWVTVDCLHGLIFEAVVRACNLRPRCVFHVGAPGLVVGFLIQQGVAQPALVQGNLAAAVLNQVGSTLKLRMSQVPLPVSVQSSSVVCVVWSSRRSCLVLSSVKTCVVLESGRWFGG